MESERLTMIDEWRRDLAASGLAAFTLPEHRPEVRDASGTGDGSWTINGYAAVFSQPTTLYEGAGLRVRELIEPAAFTRALKDPDKLVHLNHGHDMNQVMASSDVRGIGGLSLKQGNYGLDYFARVDPEVSYVRDVATLMKRGVIRGASFKFTISGEERDSTTDEDGNEDVLYRVEEIDKLYDVCVCAQGAYRQATSSVRSLDQRFEKSRHTTTSVYLPANGSSAVWTINAEDTTRVVGDDRHAEVSAGGEAVAPIVGGPAPEVVLKAMRQKLRIAVKHLH